jgi:GT2 family glycosyltransferase
MSPDSNDPWSLIHVAASEQGTAWLPVPPQTEESARLVSVVIPCCGQLEFTRRCVPALLRHSRPPFELIFLDIGSLDGTADYLAGVAAAAPARVELVRTAGELDFHAVCVEGFKRARAEFLVWLNNDTIVPAGWLQQLVGLCSGSERIGVVGPMSNHAPALQRVGPVPYRLGTRSKAQPGRNGSVESPDQDIETVNQFAGSWREAHKGQWFEADRLGGFCLLVKRSMLQRVNFFDDRADQGVFDADAFCGRVRQAGYHLACCRDLFVHHFGSRLTATN